MLNHLIEKLFMASPIIVFSIKNERVDTCHARHLLVYFRIYQCDGKA